MPSFNLTPDEVVAFRPLPGHALLRCLPAELKDSPEALIVKPESVAAVELETKAARRGELIRLTWTLPDSKANERTYLEQDEYRREFDSFCTEEKNTVWNFDSGPEDPACYVYYLGRANETDNQYVVVKILQIVAVELPKPSHL